MIVATADTNIYVSALNFGGVPLEFLNAARIAGFRLAISEALLAEIRNVLQKKFSWSEQAVNDAIAELLDFSQLVQPTEALEVVDADPDDNRVLECAIASNSQFIVSGDKHLLTLGECRGIRILKVAEFLSLMPKPPTHLR